MRHIVSDTGPILHLWEADALSLLDLTGNFTIPVGVHSELLRQCSTWQIEKPDWIHIASLVPARKELAHAWVQSGLLDEGEADAIALAQQINADWLLSDDAAARLYAESLGMEVHGSLGIVLWAAAMKRLSESEAQAVLERLAQSSLWISARVVAEAKSALQELFSP